MLRRVTERYATESPGVFGLRRRLRSVPSDSRMPHNPRAVWDKAEKRWTMPTGRERCMHKATGACAYCPLPEQTPTQQDADLATLDRYFMAHPHPNVAVLPFEEWTARVLAGESVVDILNKARGTIEADVLDDDLRRLYDAQHGRTASDNEWRDRMALPKPPCAEDAHDWQKIMTFGGRREWMCSRCPAASESDPRSPAVDHVAYCSRNAGSHICNYPGPCAHHAQERRIKEARQYARNAGVASRPRSHGTDERVPCITLRTGNGSHVMIAKRNVLALESFPGAPEAVRLRTRDGRHYEGDILNMNAEGIVVNYDTKPKHDGIAVLPAGSQVVPIDVVPANAGYTLDNYFGGV